jgi:DNA-binding response OmpR family regulator
MDRLRGSRILLVDDDDLTRELLRDYFADAGYEVMVAPNGQRACELLAGFAADLVITDLEMPGMDGLELIRWLRRSRAGCAILLITARSDRELPLCRLGRQAGFECMRKPIEVDRLGQTVERLTSSGYREAHKAMAR